MDIETWKKRYESEILRYDPEVEEKGNDLIYTYTNRLNSLVQNKYPYTLIQQLSNIPEEWRLKNIMLEKETRKDREQEILTLTIQKGKEEIDLLCRAKIYAHVVKNDFTLRMNYHERDHEGRYHDKNVREAPEVIDLCKVICREILTYLHEQSSLRLHFASSTFSFTSYGEMGNIIRPIIEKETTFYPIEVYE